MISEIITWYDKHAFDVKNGYAGAFSDRGYVRLDTLLELF